MAPPSLSWFTTSLANRPGLSKLGFSFVEELAGTANQITVVAAYWDPSFLTRLLAAIPVSRRAEVSVRVFINGFTGKRGEEDDTRLRDLVKYWRKRRLPNLSIGLLSNSRLFHSKVFIFEQVDAASILVGSANATEAAFTNNEEFMVMIRATEVPWGIRQYIDAIDENSTPLDDREPYVARNLPAFFRGGDVYYRPSVVTSFRFDLRLSPAMRSAMAQLREPIAGIVARAGQTYDPFVGVLSTEEQRRHDEVSSDGQDDQLLRARVPLSSYGVQTCYGWWVPSSYHQRIEAKLAPAQTRRKALLDRLEQLLRDPDAIRTLAVARFGELTAYARRQQFDMPESVSQRLDRFDSFLVRAKNRLADRHWRMRAEQPYVRAAVPEIWNDPTSSAEFIDSFFGYLEFISTSRKRPAIWRVMTRVIPSLEDSSSAGDIDSHLRAKLATEGWSQELWSQLDNREQV